jgi:predicted metal-dependent HD superfamily phosphohydrolase
MLEADVDRLESFVLGDLGVRLDPCLSYHGLAHTEEVVRNVRFLCAEENVAEPAIRLIRAAAVLHDTGFLFSYRQNEPQACEYARERLPEFGCGSDEIEAVCRMIMATEIPQRPYDECSRILCDADLLYLGTDLYWEKAESLRRELACHRIPFSDREWLDVQIAFLEGHTFFTRVAQRQMDPIKQTHLRRLTESRHAMDCASDIHLNPGWTQVTGKTVSEERKS